ncbi:hypothetical protein EJ110_NYTH58161 [Nymphaea thermarum]|nr:hypothetical protein EJ110_NYTH58161 [Nymphaea thermarum]
MADRGRALARTTCVEGKRECRGRERARENAEVESVQRETGRKKENNTGETGNGAVKGEGEEGERKDREGPAFLTCAPPPLPPLASVAAAQSSAFFFSALCAIQRDERVKKRETLRKGKSSGPDLGLKPSKNTYRGLLRAVVSVKGITWGMEVVEAMKMKKLALDNALLSILAVGYSKCLELDLAEGMLNQLDDNSPKYIYPFNYLLAACEIQSPRVWDSSCDREVCRCSCAAAVVFAAAAGAISFVAAGAGAVSFRRCRCLVCCLVALYAAAVSFASSPLALVLSGVGYCLSLEIVMAAEMTPKTDVAFDTGSNPKSENVPVQVTSIRLNKDNYLSWSAALEIGITSRGRLPYITGERPAPSKTDPSWATWALEDSQVKVWIISSVSADIQPLILPKSTSYDMWTVLARMYGHKKRVLGTYQIKRSIYSLKHGDLSVASFYAALKTKWEELDYHVNDDWSCGSDHALYRQKEWMDQTFIFLGGLRDEFESIRSQILNCDETPRIEEVYARVESEEQRRQVMHIDSSHGSSPSAFVSRAPGTGQRPARCCSHCNKLGHSVDFCWDLHPEKRLTHGRPPSGRRGPPVPDSSHGGCLHV